MVLSTRPATVGLAPLQLGSGDFLWWAVAFLVLALAAGLLGFTGVAGVSMSIAKWLVIIFIVLAVIAFIL
jgi:uncharacterized membrane protein YtjA (UPF0391 family)